MRAHRIDSSRVNQPDRHESRKGTILVLSAVMLVVVLAFVSFTVDFGMITVTKGQLQNAADSAALSATQELMRSYGPGSTVSSSTAASSAQNGAVDLISRFRSGDLSSTSAEAARDVRFGSRTWNSSTNQWVETWGIPPFNLVEVTARRTSEANSALPMTFSQVLGINHQNVSATSVASIAPAAGFRFNSNASTGLGVLPIAVDSVTWDLLVNSIRTGQSPASDDYSYNENSGYVNYGGDGIGEINIYPDANTNLPSGNRGTVDLGAPNNSTNDLNRQIVDGLNEYDMGYLPNGELRASPEQPLNLNGDPGISAGIESSLESIIGQVRAIPIFTTVSGNGNNASYRVVKFVGVRIMAVRLTGGPGNRHVTVQPAPFSSPHLIRGNSTIEYDSIVSKPFLVR